MCFVVETIDWIYGQLPWHFRWIIHHWKTCFSLWGSLYNVFIEQKSTGSSCSHSKLCLIIWRFIINEMKVVNFHLFFWISKIFCCILMQFMFMWSVVEVIELVYGRQAKRFRWIIHHWKCCHSNSSSHITSLSHGTVVNWFRYVLTQSCI